MIRTRTVAAWLVGALLVEGAALAGTTIVVDFGPHASADAAGRGEARVNWHDADPTDDTRCTACFAALELQRCLRAMTGRAGDFPILDDPQAPAGDLLLVGGPATNAASRRLAPALGVGAAARGRLGREGYRVKSAAVAGRRVTLVAGGGRAGTLYGAYGLLHRLGCRWFAPGEVHEHVPRATGIPDLDLTEQPSFDTRGFHAWEDRASADFLLWMARNRLNYWCVEQRNHPLLRKLCIRLACGAHDAQSRFLNPYKPYPYNHPRFARDEAKPADPYPVGPLDRGDANGDGQLSAFEAHPEWFPLVDGRRIPGPDPDRHTHGVNFCTANPHATAELVRRYVQALADGPYRDADVVRLWTLDGGTWCACAQCRALGTPTDRTLLLVHHLDREIKKARAAGRITRPIAIRFLVYQDVLAPPTRPLPADFDYATCCGTFFPSHRSYVHRFDDPASAANAPLARALAGWATEPTRHYRGPLCIGEYYNVSRFHNLPLVLMHVMAADLPRYHKLGARHVHYMHVTTGNWGTKALTNYQLARQLWDVAADCEALWQDYFARRYGPAAATMRRFYESLEPMLSNAMELRFGLARRLERGKRGRDLFPEPVLRYRREPGVECTGPTLVEMVGHAKTCRGLLDQALAGELPPRVRARVAEDERAFAYGERTVLYYHACARAYMLGWAGKRREALGHYTQARRLAIRLAGDTVSTTLSSSHANAANALVATGAAGAIERLTRLRRR